ncbi:MAG: phosphopentomutase [Clostridiales bacterium]|nr:phosphopentomutase [Clostridiales bacterium]
MKRVILIVLDSVGVGALPDAHLYNDTGANTVGHIAQKTHLALPNLSALGFANIPNTCLPAVSGVVGAFGRAAEKSSGKDTTTGHWEISGLTLEKPFPTYPNGFPQDVIDAFEKAIGTKVIGNYAASGTAILDELGEEHLRTGYPIVYTSADSVFQIACHEELFPLDKLYEMCEIARNLLTGEHGVGRVIARPFIGTGKGQFKRTGGRRDYSFEPTRDTMLDVLKNNGLQVLGVGKIEDIFAHRGLTGSNHAAGNPACVDAMLDYMKQDFSGLLFVNLVDFDMVYGHRRDVEGYKNALEAFDGQLPAIMDLMTDEDLLIITADHGCDPTHHGTDHTREYIPILCWHKGMKSSHDLGTRESYADIAATVCNLFHIPETFNAKSFLNDLEVK